MNREATLRDYYQAMLAALGPSRWWPGRTPFEIALGAILTQNTAWTNVEKAMHALRESGLLDPRALARLTDEELATFIRPAGAFRVKAARVRNFLLFLHRTCDLDMDGLRGETVETLRPALLEVSGIGPETADSILLYALGLPSFVVDAYTRRILNRHGLVPEDIAYGELREFFMDVLPPDPALYNEYHALIVRTGKNWCAKRQGKCPDCPLAVFLEEFSPLTCTGKSIIPHP
ncbi:endonuclease III domain-containing protein [Desulfomicrobium baculatum]|uniref:HhH-GPD family protein n=1 Tax=Desulfomicrobium baculatum (strain DSM 4028 / VKM B-1378 / X) TaxID=525897 RepID=C7LUN0_DESBD|nr:HhH-GPD family protein [Desulfomicrobium baculatum DSM 4028]